MPTNVPGNGASYPANVRTPSDSDSPLASGQLRTALTDLADRTEYLRTKAPGVQVDMSYTLDVAADGTTSSTWSDVPGTSTGFTANAGDRVEIFVKLRMSMSGGAEGEARCYWYNPDATTTTITRSTVGKYSDAGIPAEWLSIATMTFATQTGVHNLYVQHRSTDNTTNLTTTIDSIMVKVFRA
jgi:hypothetical protein